MPILTLLLGSGGTLATVNRTATLQWRRDRANWELERAAARDDRRAEFELETLLAVQESMTVLARGHAREAIAIRAHLRAGGAPNAYRDSDELSETVRLANGELSKLKARVLDDDVREAIDRFHATGDFLVITTEAAVIAEMERNSATFQAAQEAVGTAIRRMHRGLQAGMTT